MPTITTPTGAKFTGTVAEVADFASKMGIDLSGGGKFYYSNSKGEWISIASMNVQHIKNALLLRYREWVEELHSITDPVALLDALEKGPVDDKTLVDLMAGLAAKVGTP